MHAAVRGLPPIWAWTMAPAWAELAKDCIYLRGACTACAVSGDGVDFSSLLMQAISVHAASRVGKRHVIGRESFSPSLFSVYVVSDRGETDRLSGLARSLEVVGFVTDDPEALLVRD
ncbi:hypothetical protein B0T22DRAFT_456154 [Podospora appendiculata]|uniref:Uncharacterized protein n=1 Tax=Podospora appendiculata TaxID=314037 RepID=A0AAE0XM88_9PEZI|nr:hypothetical protein B0T22DRAFT_456154 [Podospora appendiculata]